MTVLMWDEPKKKLNKADWAKSFQFEDGPTGGYVPNMSETDSLRWKAKITGTKLGYPQVEIRKTCGSQMTVIVNLGDGYNYKSYRAEFDSYEQSNPFYMLRTPRGTFGKNIHVALNGPAVLTFDEMAEMQQAISEARDKLNTIVAVPGERQIFGYWMKDGIDYAAAQARIENHGAKVYAVVPDFNMIMVTATPVSLGYLSSHPEECRAVFKGSFVNSVADKIYDEAGYRLIGVKQKFIAAIENA